MVTVVHPTGIDYVISSFARVPFHGREQLWHFQGLPAASDEWPCAVVQPLLEAAPGWVWACNESAQGWYFGRESSHSTPGEYPACSTPSLRPICNLAKEVLAGGNQLVMNGPTAPCGLRGLALN